MERTARLAQTGAGTWFASDDESNEEAEHGSALPEIVNIKHHYCVASSTSVLRKIPIISR